MSLTAIEEIRCPCGEAFESELYQSVSAGDEPDLKDQILAGEFNMVRCPACSQLLYGERFVLYHDSAQELMAFIYPVGMQDKKAEIEKEMAQTYAKLRAEANPGALHYEPNLLFGMDRLCEMLTRE